MGDDGFAVRVYGIDDKFAGEEQTRPRFPIVSDIAETGRVIKAMLAGEADLSAYELISAERISDIARLDRLVDQRRRFRRANREALAANHRHSVFYQSDLREAATAFANDSLKMPAPLADDEPLITRISDSMFRAEVSRLTGADPQAHEERAFSLLREGLTRTVLEHKELPRRDVCSDQIVWSRSPVRIDIAGGWTDTPPFCLMEGGNVINFAIELNGQQPLQAYVRPCPEPHIICRSIDLGAEEIIESFDGILDFHRVGSPFSIPKAALALAGFHPRFCSVSYPSLRDQLLDFGSGLEITLFSAIPAGSGLGTSSILAATVLGALSDFCTLAWDKNEICKRTLVLEQLLTTGGGWQDQVGGLTNGIKFITTKSGIDQKIRVEQVIMSEEAKKELQERFVLIYTGQRRLARNLLREVVGNYIGGRKESVDALSDMKVTAVRMRWALEEGDIDTLAELFNEHWELSKQLDMGATNTCIDQIFLSCEDLIDGRFIAGAGGGGFLQAILKKGVTKKQLSARLHEVFQDNGVDVWESEFV